MTFYALIDDVVDDCADRRQDFRNLRLSEATAVVARGDLILGGTIADPVVDALLIFRSTDRSMVEEFAPNDLYVFNGLVKTWTIHE